MSQELSLANGQKILRPPRNPREMASDLHLLLGRRDLNPRPLDPQGRSVGLGRSAEIG
jgi:hypothetical protein